MLDKDARQMANEAIELSKEIRPMLADRGPEVQGAVIADLLATYIAGHRPDTREPCLNAILDVTRKLVGVCEQEIKTRHGKDPWQDWKNQQNKKLN